MLLEPWRTSELKIDSCLNNGLFIDQAICFNIFDKMDKARIVNAKDIKRLIRRDKMFAAIYKQYGQPPDWSREPGFISLSKIILEQQVSLASANAHFQKLNTYLGEFSPSNILKLTDEEMRTCQISRQK